MLRKTDLDHIQNSLAELDVARDSVSEASRVCVRSSNRAIIELHRGDLKRAAEHIAGAEEALRDLERALGKRRELKCMGAVTLAYQEYAEAKLHFGMATKDRILSFREVGVEVEPYLLGLLDFIGELRRMCLNYLRAGELSRSESILKMMEGIYEDLYSIDHTAIISGFRPKMDAARRIIESTRGDVVSESRKLMLENALRDFEERVFGRLSAQKGGCRRSGASSA
ncbi:MAG: translin family protein [Candidatus Bathyarchaeia archaeon]